MKFMTSDELIFRNIYHDVLHDGELVKPRGQLVRELENYSFTLPPYTRFPSFKSRKLNLDYVRKEFLWYLKGDRTDLSICERAKIWKDIINTDGTLNSNYGQYVFGEGNQFDRVIKLLTDDVDSRRASMTILSRDHVLSDTKDLPCTYAINFRIRDHRLNMSVHMRSQDAIYGMGNDLPAFSFIHEMVMNALKRVHPGIQLGSYFHVVDSFHVYERHFGMLETIVWDDPYNVVECPRISGPEEVDLLRRLHAESMVIPDEFLFARWLLNV